MFICIHIEQYCQQQMIADRLHCQNMGNHKLLKFIVASLAVMVIHCWIWFEQKVGCEVLLK